MSLQRQILLSIFKLFDLLVMTFSFGLATAVTYFKENNIALRQLISMRIKIENIFLFLGALILWHTFFYLFGLYHSRRLSTRWAEIKDIVAASSLANFTIFVTTNLFNATLVTPIFLLVFWTSSTVISILSRLILRHALKRIRICDRNLRNMLIAGTNPRAIQFAQKIIAKKELGYRIIGFVDNNWQGITEFKKTGYSLVTNFNGLPSFLRKNIIDEVMIVLPMKSAYHQAASIIKLCGEQGIIVRIHPSIFDLKMARSKTEQFEEDLIITLFPGAMTMGWPILIKRIIDIAISLILLILLAIPFLIIAFLIKLTSSGPIFFVQERVGFNKRKFKLYKFRTMIPTAEQKLSELKHLNEVSGPVFKIKNDPRITRFGKILRRTSVDELPQLINVLKGDMSLVGPRPLPVRDYEGFKQDWHRRRFCVRPGITCLWQVNGRNSIPFEKWMHLDMQYIDRWSLWLDLKILVKTIPAVLKGTGAS